MSTTTVSAPGRGATLRLPILRWPIGLGSLIVGVVCAVPLVFLLVSSFVVSQPGAPTVYGLANWTSAFSYPGSVGALEHSFELTLVREAIALPVALGVTWLVSRTDMVGRRLVEGASWLSILVPILPLTLGWILLADPSYGLLNDLSKHLFGRAIFDIYGFWGITWVYLATNAIAFKVVLLAPTFRRMGVELEEAGRMCGASRLRTMAKITIPVLAPAVLFVTVAGVVFSLQGFQVELLLGEPVRYYVYSTQIYNLVNNTPPGNGQAAVLGTVFLAVLGGLTIGYRRFLGRRSFLSLTGRGYSVKIVRLRGWRWPVGILCILAFLAMIIMPLVVLVLGSFMRIFGFFNLPHPFTLSSWTGVLSDPSFRSTLENSAIICSASAVGSVIVYLLVAHSIVRRRSRLLSTADQLLWAPWASPGILMSLGLLGFFLETPLRSALYGTLFGLIVAFVIQQAPLSSQLFRASLLQIGPDIEDAARICGASRLRVYGGVLMRMILPTAIGVAVLTFLLSLQDIPTAVLLYTPQTEPLSILMLNYANGGSDVQGAVVGVLTTAISLIFLLVIRLVAPKLISGRGQAA